VYHLIDLAIVGIIYYIGWRFSLKQSRQKKVSQAEQKVFIFFAVALLASLNCCCRIFS